MSGEVEQAGSGESARKKEKEKKCDQPIRRQRCSGRDRALRGLAPALALANSLSFTLMRCRCMKPCDERAAVKLL